MRKPIIAGNWKMNMTPTEAAALVKELLPLVRNASCDVVICPPAVDFCAVAPLIEGTNLALGSQNVHWEDKGAYTGEISGPMLLELGVKYAIVGHSERREYFSDTDSTVNRRALAALRHGITPIICVGETLEQREASETEPLLRGQVKAALTDISGEQAAGVVIAYEPIWAIGTGKTATAQMADEATGVIRDTVKLLYGPAVAEAVRIQYGGSMNPKNSAELMAMPNIDCGLIGGASLKAADFSAVVASAV